MHTLDNQMVYIDIVDEHDERNPGTVRRATPNPDPAKKKTVPQNDSYQLVKDFFHPPY